jgi:glucose-1-phosphatase
MSATIEAAIFDMDGVLCAYDFAARLDHMARLIGSPAPDIRAEIFDSGWDARSDRGEIGTAAYLAGCSTRLGTEVSRAAWLEARAAAMTPNLDVLAIARSLAAHLPVAVLTNNNRLLAENLPGVFPQVPEIFGEHVYVSAVLGLAKPDPAAYLAVMARLEVAEPGRVLFIDDRADYIAGAEGAGLKTHLFRNAAALRTDIASLGLAVV